MFYPNFKAETKIKLEFERDPKSIFSVPNDNLTINIINQIIDNILNFDFIKDFDENISSNYEKESLLFNTFYKYFREIEKNMTNDCYENVLKIINAIFFVLEYFTLWLHEIDRNVYREILETLSFYLNHISIAIVFYFNFGYKKIIIDLEFVDYLKNLLKEIQIYSSFLNENFNINSIMIYDINNFINLFNLSKDELNKNIYELLNCKLQKDGFLLYFDEYPIEHPLFKIKEKCLKSLNRINKIDLGKHILK